VLSLQSSVSGRLARASVRPPDHGGAEFCLHHQPCGRNARRGRRMVAKDSHQRWNRKTDALSFGATSISRRRRSRAKALNTSNNSSKTTKLRNKPRPPRSRCRREVLSESRMRKICMSGFRSRGLRRMDTLKRKRYPEDLLRAPFRGGRVPRPFWSD
jgi:hypothetical protein